MRLIHPRQEGVMEENELFNGFTYMITTFLLFSEEIKVVSLRRYNITSFAICYYQQARE